jgi:hypothetical protein
MKELFYELVISAMQKYVQQVFGLFFLVLLSGYALSAQNQTSIQQQIQGKWQWIEYLEEPGRTPRPTLPYIITPKSCGCERVLTITPTTIKSHKATKGKLYKLSAVEQQKGIQNSSTYTISEGKALFEEEKPIFINSDILLGQITIKNDTMLVFDLSCASRYQIFKKIGP